MPTPGVTDGYTGIGVMLVPFIYIKTGRRQSDNVFDHGLQKLRTTRAPNIDSWTRCWMHPQAQKERHSAIQCC